MPIAENSYVDVEVFIISDVVDESIEIRLVARYEFLEPRAQNGLAEIELVPVCDEILERKPVLGEDIQIGARKAVVLLEGSQQLAPVMFGRLRLAVCL